MPLKVPEENSLRGAAFIPRRCLENRMRHVRLRLVHTFSRSWRILLICASGRYTLNINEKLNSIEPTCEFTCGFTRRAVKSSPTWGNERIGPSATDFRESCHRRIPRCFCLCKNVAIWLFDPRNSISEGGLATLRMENATTRPVEYIHKFLSRFFFFILHGFFLDRIILLSCATP